MKDAAELTRHIKSITQTRQITNAMFLTSSSKMRKALKIYAENRAFTQSLAPVIKSIIESGLYKDTNVLCPLLAYSTKFHLFPNSTDSFYSKRN